MNKAQFAALVTAEVNDGRPEGKQLKGRDVAAVLNATYQAIVDTLVEGESVAVTNFGTFLPVVVSERVARNPQTGEQVTVPARTRAKFRPSPTLRAIMVDPENGTSIRKRSSR